MSSIMKQLRELEKQIAPIAIFVDAMRKNKPFYLEMKTLFEKEGLQEVFAELTATFNDVSWDDVKQVPHLFEPTTQHLPNQKLRAVLQDDVAVGVKVGPTTNPHCVGDAITIYQRFTPSGEYFLGSDDLLKVVKILHPHSPKGSFITQPEHIYRVTAPVCSNDYSLGVYDVGEMDDFMEMCTGRFAVIPPVKMSVVEFITTKLKISLLKSQAE